MADRDIIAQVHVAPLPSNPSWRGFGIERVVQTGVGEYHVYLQERELDFTSPLALTLTLAGSALAQVSASLDTDGDGVENVEVIALDAATGEPADCNFWLTVFDRMGGEIPPVPMEVPTP